MISRREAELLARRAVLRERIRQQRTMLADAAQPLARACGQVDQWRALAYGVIGAAHTLTSRHPWTVALVMGVMVALRPRRAWRLARRVFWAWRLIRRATGLWQRLTAGTPVTFVSPR